MKLISKTLIYYLLVSLPLLVIAGLLSYFLIKTELRDGTDETLASEKTHAERLIRSLNVLNPIYLSIDSLSTIKLSSGSKLKSGYIDTLVFNVEEGENVSARILRSYYTFKGRTFQITLLKTTMEEEELLESILATFTMIIGFLILSFVIVNWMLSKTLWKPFYITLSQLKNYDIQSHAHQQFSSENTKEFNQLNEALSKMTDKIYLDFIQQKEFTENASHEMQTPLAVLKANLSLLMQSPHLKEEEMNQLQIIENTVKKLSSLNKALILLSKIENNQFVDSEAVSIKALVSRVTDNFAEVIQSKRISLDIELREDILVKMNPVLAEILFTNLLQNAIRHNKGEGKIVITIKDNQLEIANTGEPLNIPEEEMFIRFKKNDASKESLGLGLSIVNGIAKFYGFKVHYSFADPLHRFGVFFG